MKANKRGIGRSVRTVQHIANGVQNISFTLNFCMLITRISDLLRSYGWNLIFVQPLTAAAFLTCVELFVRRRTAFCFRAEAVTYEIYEKKLTKYSGLKGQFGGKWISHVLGFVVLRDVVKVFPVSSSSFSRKTTGRNQARSHSGHDAALKRNGISNCLFRVRHIVMIAIWAPG